MFSARDYLGIERVDHLDRDEICTLKLSEGTATVYVPDLYKPSLNPSTLPSS